jgi:VCBS repeat-containing protein
MLGYYQPNYRRIGITITVALTLTSLGLVAGGTLLSNPTSAATMQPTGFTVADVNKTVDGQLEDVALESTISFDYQVDNAETMTMQLVAGPTKNQTDTVSYTANTDAPAENSGEITLTGSLLETSNLTASDFRPASGGNTTQTLVVGVVMQVETTHGETETVREYDTVVVTLSDTANQIEVAGTGQIVIETSADS